MKPRDSTLLPHLKRIFGSTPMRKIGEKEMLDYRKKRSLEKAIRHGKASKRGISAATINKELGLLRKLMRLAMSKGYVKALPKFAMEKEQNRERKLSAEEYSKLLENSPPWLKRVYVAAYETCLTRGDLLGLTWNEVDRQRWVIQLKGGRDKTKVKQEIPIRTDELVTLFQELEAERKSLPNVGGLVFTREGRQIREMQLRRALQRACKAAGISDFTFHDFRHCAITRWHELGVHVSVAMRMAGHSSVQSNKKYVNLGTNEVIEVYTNCLQRNSTPAQGCERAVNGRNSAPTKQPANA